MLPLSINIATSNLEDDDFVEQITAALARHAIPPAMLETNKVFTYAVATKKPFTPIATSHTLSSGQWVKHGLAERQPASPPFRGTSTDDRSSSRPV